MLHVCSVILDISNRVLHAATKTSRYAGDSGAVNVQQCLEKTFRMRRPLTLQKRAYWNFFCTKFKKIKQIPLKRIHS